MFKMFRVTILLIFSSVYSSVESQQRLSNNTIPLHYDIKITPSISDLTFLGEIVITVEVQKPTDTLTLNAKNLNISAAEIYDYSSNNASDIIDSLVEDDSDTITFNSGADEGIFDLRLTYTGRINENFEGLYVSKYTKKTGDSESERPFLLTNFQYAKARQAFPCFDHPSFPATFAISIARTADYISLSNMAQKSEKNLSDDKILDEFATSDMIPTYLVSFAVIDFEKVPVDKASIYTVEKENTNLMIELSTQAFEKFNQLYPVKLNKIDHVIVPDDSLPRDVLEAVGLIIYRKSAVLFNEKTQSTEEKQSILKLITHAIAKQSYKEVDTSNWWTHFWINEGILVMYQYELCSAIHPEWELLEQFVVKDFHEALRQDVIKENDIVLVIEDAPDDLSETFYTKAFSLIRMASNLKLPGDITEISDNSIPYSWAKLEDYPILSATRDYEENTITFSQEAYTESSWAIPISVATEDQQNFDDTQFIFLLTEEALEIDAALVTSMNDSWYIVNKQEIGYYRVSYNDENNWNLIVNYLKSDNFEEIDRINRAQLIDDSFYLGDTDSIEEFDYDMYFQLIGYIQEEEDFIPLTTFFKTTSHLKSLLTQTETQTKFINFTVNLARNLYAKVGTTLKPTDTHIERLNRINVLTWLCNFGDETCQKEMFGILSKNASVHPDMQEPVYCGGMRLGQLENFAFLLDQYKLSPNARIIRSMGCTSNPDLLRRYLEGVIGESVLVQLNTKDRVAAFLAVVEGSDEGVDMALDFTKQHFETIFNSFNDREVTEIFARLSQRLFTREQEAKINQTIDCLTDDQKTKYQSLITTIRENVKINQEWRRMNLDDIDKWLDPPESTSTITTPETTTNRTTSSKEPSPTKPASTTVVTDTPGSTTSPGGSGGAAALRSGLSWANLVTSLILLVVLLKCN